MNKGQKAGNSPVEFEVVKEKSYYYSEQFSTGDNNFDGSIDVIDIVLIINISIDTYVPNNEEFAASDVNQDGSINELDILENQDYRGILICGSGVGMSIAANKFSGIRAANVTDEITTIQSVEHNNVNVLGLGANNVDNETAKNLISVFLSANFTKEDRYLRRINKLTN